MTSAIQTFDWIDIMTLLFYRIAKKNIHQNKFESYSWQYSKNAQYHLLDLKSLHLGIKIYDSYYL